MDELEFYLSISFHERSSFSGGPRMTADVQVWRGKDHIQTVKIVGNSYLEFPEHYPITTAENFAAIASRMAARLIDEHYYDSLERGNLHTRQQLHDEDIARHTSA